MVGIYKITNKTTGEIYIGQSRNLDLRIKQHKNIKSNDKLHSDIQSLGIENFEFEIIESWSPMEDKIKQGEKLNTLECNYIKQYNCLYPNGYNKAGGGYYNYIICEDTRKLITENSRKALIKRWADGSFTGMLARKHQQETIDKIKHSNLGKKHDRSYITPEYREKLSNALKNKVVSEETRQKLREANLGEKNPMYGKKMIVSPETRKKISESKKGHVVDEETRRKISETLKERNRKQKQGLL